MEIEVHYDSDGVVSAFVTKGHIDKAAFLEAMRAEPLALEELPSLEAESGGPVDEDDVRHHHMVMLHEPDEEDEEPRWRYCAADVPGATPITAIFWQ